MNSEAEYVHQEINRFVLLLRSEKDEEQRQKYLDSINKLNGEQRRLYDSK
jgi:hypothetical protein